MIACDSTEDLGAPEPTNYKIKRSIADSPEMDVFCCDKMSLTIDFEALGIDKNLQREKKWHIRFQSLHMCHWNDLYVILYIVCRDYY